MGKQGENQVSVVIPTWNAAQHVARVLELLVAQEGVSFEIVVVDNGVVNRETEEVCERFRAAFPDLRYLRFEKQLGYAGAVNEGTAAARCALVAVINNDNLPEKRWLAELVAELDRHGGRAVVCSLVSRPDFPDALNARMNIWGRLVRIPRAGKYIPFHPDGSAFLFSRNVFGIPYDPDYFIYHEDVALGWRAWLMGHEVALAEQSLAATFDGGSTRRIKYLTAYYTERNRWLNYLVFLSGFSLVRLLPLLWLDAMVKLAGGSNRRAKLHAWGWFFSHPLSVWRKRNAMQRLRKRSDAEILPLLSFRYADAGKPGSLLNSVIESYCRLVGII